MKRFFILFISFFVFSCPAFALQYNNVSLSPQADYYAAHYSHNSFEDVSSLYLYAPANFAFDNINSTIRINPFYSSHYDKLSLAEAFWLFNYKYISVKAGRQFLSFDNDFFIYFGPDNRYDNPKPSYIDGALLGFDYTHFKAQAFWADYDGNIAGADIKILKDYPLSLGLFSYYKELSDGKLFVSGLSADIELSEQLSLSAAFAFNRGHKTYTVFGVPYKKHYEGTALIAQSKYYTPYKYVDFYLTAAYAFTSASKQESLAFKSISQYNIYGFVAGSGELFKQDGIKSVKLNLNAIPANLKELNFDISLFYYYSSDGNIAQKYIGSEWDFATSWMTKYSKLTLYAGIFSPNKDFTRYQLPRESTAKLGAYISLFNFL